MDHTSNNDPNKYIPETYIPHVESHGTKKIWTTFWLLTAITILDIFLYFSMEPTMTRNIIFIAFGLVKAYYIVGTFMHLRDEKVNLLVGILGPVIFIVGLVMGLLQEGHVLSVILGQ